MYDLAFAFWRHLATEQANLPGGVALANLSVPYLLSNAAWYLKPGQLQSIAEWYAVRELPPALIVPSSREKTLERTLQEGPFMLERSFTFREAVETKSESLVEQVDWRQTRYAGELLARYYDQPDLGLPIASTLTQVMQQTSDVQLFLGYQDDPVGTMVTFEQGDTLLAMLSVDKNGGLEARLAQDAVRRGLQGFVLEALPDGVTVGGGLERWSIR